MKTPRRIKSAALLACCAVAVFPAAAEAACSSGERSFHTSSWGLHDVSTNYQSCLNLDTNGYIYGTADVSTWGTAGYDLKVYSRVKNVTTGTVYGTVATYHRDQDGEANLMAPGPAPNLGMMYKLNSPKMTPQAGHKYITYTWVAIDVDKDGKGYFTEATSISPAYYAPATKG